MIRKALVGAIALAFGAAAQAQEKYEVKVAEFVGAQHFMTKWIMQWSEKLEKASNGRLVFKHFPNAQMAATPAHYDLARTGQAEISWFLHGGTPGRFPLTEIVNLPYMVGSAEIGTKVLNDAELRAKYLDAEHRGVKVLMLFTHQPGNVHTTKKPIRTQADMKGMRIRFASPTVRDFIAGLGATPVGVQPTEILEQLQKGGIDGAFIDYGGAGVAFKMGGTVKFTTEMYSYVTSFGLAANPDWYGKLPGDLRKLIDDSLKGVEKEVGEGWDALDSIGKKLLVDAGAQPIRLTKEEDARFRKIGAEVTEAKLKELQGKGMPAVEVHKLMRSLSDKHEKDSKNFWKQ
ncbi:MAG TPA: TRAP transporter substrate-binding protein [Burkholderiales bacterium]|nr:TRAP transporter substrate-binding protein [Burkholderiales bacterium]